MAPSPLAQRAFHLLWLLFAALLVRSAAFLRCQSLVVRPSRPLLPQGRAPAVRGSRGPKNRMSLMEPEEDWREARDAYSRKQFWDNFYTDGEAGDVEKGETYDWFVDYKKLRPYLIQYLGGARAGRVIILGCGSSELPAKMFADGWSSVTGVDFSAPCIAALRLLHADKAEAGLHFETMDARDMTAVPDGSFDAVIEKGLVDAMAYSDSYRLDVGKVAIEAARILRPGGVHLSVSIKPPDSFEPLFEPSAVLWEGGAVREVARPTPSTYLYVGTKKGGADGTASGGHGDGGGGDDGGRLGVWE